MALRRRAGTFAGGALSAGMARLNARHPWSHNDHFHSWILANLPEPCRTALDVGCGRGELVAALAPHVTRVIGNDTDDTMREQAKRRCAGLSNVTITGGDWAGGEEETFDLVTMVAFLHHLDVAETLRQVRRRLTPGGRFVAVGLAAPRTFQDHAWDLTSMVTNPIIGYVKHPWQSTVAVQPPPFPVRDPTLSFDGLRLLLDDVMPGAATRHRLAFRHTIAWTNPPVTKPPASYCVPQTNADRARGCR